MGNTNYMVILLPLLHCKHCHQIAISSFLTDGFVQPFKPRATTVPICDGPIMQLDRKTQMNRDESSKQLKKLSIISPQENNAVFLHILIESQLEKNFPM